MTTTHVLTSPTLAPSTAPTSGTRAIVRRMPATLVGLIGAVVLGYGVTQPWISTFQGLLTQSGWSTRNGNILFAGAIVAGLLAVVSAIWASTAVRWLLALVGFGTAAFGGYLLIQLYTVTQTSDSMVFLGRGPGLYLATAGAAVVFSTIFLPMPLPATTSEEPTGESSRLFTAAIASPLRFPAALLAVVAGLAHVPVTPDHLNEAPYIGISFMVLTTVCVVLAATMLVWDSAVVWATLGAACLLAVVAYVLSRTVGLPLMADDVGNWMERLGVISVLTESGVVVLAGFALARARRRAHKPDPAHA
jgi:hypothetical protein